MAIAGLTERQSRMPSRSALAVIEQPSDDPYQNLANAIVATAVDDYLYALKHKNKKLIKSLDEFFYSKWYRTLTHIDADELIQSICELYEKSEDVKEVS